MYKSNCVSRFWIQDISRLQLEHGYNGFQEISCCSRPCASYRSWYALFSCLPRMYMFLTMVAGSPAKRANPACDFLEPIKTDLIENLFTNECGDAVSLLSSYYEHLSKDRLYRPTALYVCHSMMPSEFPQP